MLEYQVLRSTRKSGPEMKYTFKKAGTRQGWVIRLKDDFTIPGDLSNNAMMISLQGLANKTGPLVYLLYPADWPFNYVIRRVRLLQEQALLHLHANSGPPLTP